VPEVSWAWRREIMIGSKLSLMDQIEIDACNWYRYDGRCELTKVECDYKGYGGKGYCEGCCRAG
jgi:hypothetical protein